MMMAVDRRWASSSLVTPLAETPRSVILKTASESFIIEQEAKHIDRLPFIDWSNGVTRTLLGL